ncbi:putative Adenylate kinase 7 [Blattamonas nauphoetae]|uniref:Adenylate kinase 7 n=1 Tax=Blattamonas nauphoetae TaxID=2049346 RepID=A0ABQ9XZI3_9EUKA|nr:putative Adenylate kinase 7 [Blattamonas nauphoetae]
MRIFISNIDSYLQKRVFTTFCLNDSSKEHSFIATLQNPETDLTDFRRVEHFVTVGLNEQYRDAILSCDIIIFDLMLSLNEANITMDILSTHSLASPKKFICISTFLTWAKTPKSYDYSSDAPPSEEPESEDFNGTPRVLPFTELDRRKRQAHVGYSEHLVFEKILLRLDGTQNGNLKTFVLNPGILYGDGEETLDKLFRMAWDCNPECLPIFGSTGRNIVPLIHVRDMANIVHRVCFSTEEKDNIILCSEPNSHTQQDITSAISRSLGTNKTQVLGTEETLLAVTGGFLSSCNMETNIQLDGSMVQQLLVDIPFESRVLSQWTDFEWYSTDFVASIWKTCRAYRFFHKLRPHRILVTGPPSSGKSTIAEKLSVDLGAELINLRVLFEYWRHQPSSNNPDEPNLADAVRVCIDRTNHHSISDALLGRMLRDYLVRWEVRHRGYVLDGYPRSYANCQVAFEKIVHTEGEEQDNDDDEEIQRVGDVSLEEWEFEEAEGEKEKQLMEKEGNENREAFAPKPEEPDPSEISQTPVQTSRSNRSNKVEQPPQPEPEKHSEESQPESQESPRNKNLFHSVLPTACVSIACSDETIKARMKLIPERFVKGTHNDEAGVERRLKAYREANATSNVKEWAEKNEIPTLEIDMDTIAENPLSPEEIVKQFIIAGSQQDENKEIPQTPPAETEPSQPATKLSSTRGSRISIATTRTPPTEPVEQTQPEPTPQTPTPAEHPLPKQTPDFVRTRQYLSQLHQHADALLQSLSETAMGALMESLLQVLTDQPENPVEEMAKILQTLQQQAQEMKEEEPEELES